MSMVFLAFVSLVAPAHAAPPPTTLNFQGRLMDSTGALLPDGEYNMQFRIFSGPSGGSALWTETRQTTNRVEVTNGLFAVQLGSVTSLDPAVFAATDLYFEITMPTPGTATCDTNGCASWESPMSPRNKLATSAYAFNAATLNGYSHTDFAAASGSTNYIQNTTSPQTANFNITGNGTIGTNLTVSGTMASGVLTVTNGATIGDTLAVTGATTLTSTLDVSGVATFKNGTDSTSAFRIQNATGISLLTADTSNNRLVVGVADTAGTLLVLDTKTDAGDPTGVAGAMYYNSNASKFRCYENSTWKDCITDANKKTTPTAKTSNYTAVDGDFIIANSAGGSFTVTLPAPTAGAIVSIKKVNAGNAITVDAVGGAYIDDQTSYSLSTQWLSQDYFSDGTQWYRI